METVIVKVILKVPKGFNGVGSWDREASLESFIEHWLAGGYYIEEGYVKLPEGIEYEGFEIAEDG